MKYQKLRVYLSERRVQLGYSQYRVAAELGISHQHYSRIESGRIGKLVSFRTMIKIADVLQMDINELRVKEIEYQNSLD